jgi:hypothetical protein
MPTTSSSLANAPAQTAVLRQNTVHIATTATMVYVEVPILSLQNCELEGQIRVSHDMATPEWIDKRVGGILR